VGRFVALFASAGVLIVCAFGTTASSDARPDPDVLTVLGEGGSGNFEWSVKLGHQSGAPGAGRQGAERPCLIATTIWQVDRFSYFRSRSRSCVHLPDRLTRFEAPLLVSGGQPSNGAPVRRSAVGMVFAPEVERVQVKLCDGREEAIRLDPMTPAQSRQARVARFRYAVFSVPGEWCAGRIVSRDRTGRPLWDSDLDPLAR
jgi:hypothetical protein